MKTKFSKELLGPRAVPPLAFPILKTIRFLKAPSKGFSHKPLLFFQYKYMEKNQHRCDQIKQLRRFSGLRYTRGGYTVKPYCAVSMNERSFFHIK